MCCGGGGIGKGLGVDFQTGFLAQNVWATGSECTVSATNRYRRRDFLLVEKVLVL